MTRSDGPAVERLFLTVEEVAECLHVGGRASSR